MHSAPILAPRPTSDALYRVQWERTIAGYIVDVIEPIAILALIGLVLGCWSGSGQKGFLIFASLALALTAARRLNNAITAWTDLLDLATYAWLASVMWIPTVAAWTFAWNRWCLRPWRSADVAAIVLAVVGLIGAVAHSASLTSGSRLASIALFVVIDRLFRRRAPRSPRRAGHLVSVRYRRVADTVHLRDRHPARGRVGRANLPLEDRDRTRIFDPGVSRRNTARGRHDCVRCRDRATECD
jgi:hypothetical protein